MNVEIVEVGPRDGLQNEARILDVDSRLRLIAKLAAAGIKRIEAGACVAPKKVPQMAGSGEVFRRLPADGGVGYIALVPNLRYLEEALAPAISEIAVFTAASDSFIRANLNRDAGRNLDEIAEVAAAAKAAGRRVRGYISTAVVCPFEGAIAPARVAARAARLAEAGCDEVSLGDTIGAATPAAIGRLIKETANAAPVEMLAAHFHDTFGQAIANIRAALDCGVRVIDAAVAGLGGCPFAPGAGGNAASEDVVYLLAGEGLRCGIDFDKLAAAGECACRMLDRPGASKAAAARRAQARTIPA